MHVAGVAHSLCAGSFRGAHKVGCERFGHKVVSIVASNGATSPGDRRSEGVHGEASGCTPISPWRRKFISVNKRRHWRTSAVVFA